MGIVSFSDNLIRYGCLVDYDEPSTLNLNFFFLSICTYQDILRQSLTKTLVSHFFNVTFCHAPDPGSTRLANPNRFRGVKPYTGTPYFFFFLS